MEEGDEEAGPERQQVGRGAAGVEEEDEEAGLERQRVGRGAVGGPERQRPWRKRIRKQGRRGSSLTREVVASGGRVEGRAWRGSS